ncbi:MAG: DUF3090 family protein [Actinomycetota bacterium]
MSADALVPDIFTTDYIGEPGQRSFFVQIRTASATQTLTIEKQQVAVLAEKLTEMLLMIDPGDPVREGTLERDPVLDAVPMPGEWRVGAVGIAYDETTELIVIEFGPVEQEGLEEPADPPELLRIALTKDKVRAFALHALAVINEGRPECQLCGLPMDPAGHACPATNGHHPN